MYTYDENGRLIEVSPDHNNLNGSYSPIINAKIHRKRHRFTKTVAAALGVVMLTGAAGAGGAYFAADYVSKQLPDNSPETVVLGTSASQVTSELAAGSIAAQPSVGSMTPGAIYDMACRQVVGVATSYTTTNMFSQQSALATTGSGFIISESGYILTNYHVVEYSVVYGYDLSVILYDGTEYPAEIVGTYEANDLAVLKIDAKGLDAVAFGSSDSLLVGDTVYAVGNPLGELSYSMTSGIVSATEREIQTDSSTSIRMFQLDAAVNSGNSGGPVYDADGKVVGIVTAKYSSSGVEGLGFAIPIDDAVTIATELIMHGYVTGEAFLGITAVDVTSTNAQYYSIPVGVCVYSVNEGSCAELAGIKAGDIITAIDGAAVNGLTDLKSVLREYSAGDSAKVTVYRSGNYFDTEVTFDERIPESRTESNQQPQLPGPSGVPGSIPGFGG